MNPGGAFKSPGDELAPPPYRVHPAEAVGRVGALVHHRLVFVGAPPPGVDDNLLLRPPVAYPAGGTLRTFVCLLGVVVCRG